MKVLTLSIDRSIPRPESPVRARMREYASLVEELHIVVPVSGTQRAEMIREDNLVIYAVRGRAGYILRVLQVAWTLFRSEEKWILSSENPFELGMLGYFIKWVFRVPLQLQLHTDVASPYFKKGSRRNAIQVRLAKFCLPRADGIRAVSQRVKRGIVESFSVREESVEVLPIFTDTQYFSKSEPTFDLHDRYPGAFIVLMASRLSPEKNIRLAIEACVGLAASYPQLMLLVVGNGPQEKQLKKQAASSGGRIVFEPWTDDLRSYYSTAADIFFSTSDYEGWGMAIVEAAASGLPVVMTETGCAGEFIVHNESGIIVPVQDKEALQHAISRLIEDPELRQRLGRRAQQDALKLEDKRAYLNRYRVLWESCVLKS